MIRKSSVALAATGIVTALALAACGGSATSYAYSTLASKASGPVNLASFDPDYNPQFFGLATTNDRTLTTGGTGVAKVNVNATYNGGNWGVSGTWVDGDVQFKLQGWAFECFHEGMSGCPLPYTTVTPLGAPPIRSSVSSPSTVAFTGGYCVPVVTHYTSTNTLKPGTGWAYLMVCDGGGGLSIGGLEWDNADYIAVYIPAADAGDANPFVNYLSGGYLGIPGVKGYTQNKAVFALDPSYSPSPSWSTPSPDSD